MKPSCTNVHNKDMEINEDSLPVRQTGIRNNLIYNNIIQFFSNERK